MSFWEHLQELRVRIVRSLLAVAMVFALTYAWRFKLWAWAQKPFLGAMARQTGKAVANLDPFISTTLITGVMFELPVLFLFLAKFRIVTARLMLKSWRHATMAILIFSAFFTPGDVVVTTIFFSIVLLGLYFISVAVAWINEPRCPAGPSLRCISPCFLAAPSGYC